MIGKNHLNNNKINISFFYTKTTLKITLPPIVISSPIYNCSIVILASKPINSLNNVNTLEEEFKRTASRLYEMTIVKPD